MNEQWRPVVGYEGYYEVSDQGRVRSVDRVVGRNGGLASGRPVHIRGRMRKLHRNVVSGYLCVGLTKDGVGSTRTVHGLVMEAFVGPCPDGMEIRHLDGDPENSFRSNLSYSTHSDNVMDKRAHGTDHNLVKTHCPSGHPYDDENTYVLPSRPNARYCKACHRARSRKAA